MAEITNLTRRPETEAAADTARRGAEVLAQMYAHFSYDDLPVPARGSDAPEYALVA